MNKKNLANAELLTSITDTQTTLEVKQGQGTNFPSAPFFITATPLGVLSTIDNSEIMRVTDVTDDTLTVERGQRGSFQYPFSGGSLVVNGIYAEDISSLEDSLSTKQDSLEEITEAEITAGTASTARAISGRRAGFLQRLITGINHPVGSLYFNADDPTNPGTLFGVGTWEPYAEGRVPVGKADSGTFSTAGDTVGEETVTLTASQIPNLSIGVNRYDSLAIKNAAVAGGATHQGLIADGSPGANRLFGSTTNTGGGSHNNIQPSIVVYIWRRTA